jgi:hypothetical protein
MLKRIARYFRDFAGGGRDERAIQEWVLSLRPDSALGER